MSDTLFKKITIGLISIWLVLLALLPFVLVIGSSFLQMGNLHLFRWHFVLSNYEHLFRMTYLHIFLRSLAAAFTTTLLCLLLGYPFAYCIAKAPEKMRTVLLFLIIIPFWTSSLIRTYAIITIIKAHGLLNSLLLSLHLIHQPLQILYTQWASQLGLVYTLFPFMVLPLFATLEKFDWQLVDAARDLGASKRQAFRKVVLPMSVPGILSGCLLVLLPAMTLFYIPDVLGGAKSLLLGNLIYNEFLEVRNWPMGASMSIALTVIMLLFLWVYSKFTNKEQRQALL
jgi:spermidine/putrescine transport system permease protein